jgi:hypothetical protein
MTAALSGISDYLDKKVLTWLAGTAFPTAPTNLYFALFSVSPTDGGLTVAGTETDYASYVRKTVAVAAAFGAPSGTAPETITNSAGAVVFATATGNSSANVVAWGVFDASSAGNLLCYGPVGTPATVASGQTPTFALSTLTLSLE